MAALVQSFPQQSSTMTMLDTRPTSASGHFQQDRPSQQQRSHNARSLYGGGGSNANVHRGQTSNAPVAPYAFTSTPSLAGYANPLRQNPSLPYLRQENRAVTAPPAPTGFSNAVSSKPRSATPANDITPSPRPDGPLQAVKSLPGGSLDLSLSDPRLAASSSATAAKPSPDRYRRLNHRSSSGGLSSPLGGASSSPSGSGMAAVNHLYQHPGQSLSSPALRSNTSGSRLQSVDDSVLSRNGEQKKHRRRSMSGLGPADAPTGQPAVVPPPMTRSYASVVSTPYTPGKREARPIQRAPQPASSHGRNGSQESVSSRSASRPGSAKRDDSPLRAHISAQSGTGQRLEPKLVNVPQRGSSDNNRRTVNPSPLSKPVAMKSDLPVAINGPGKGNVVANAQDSPAPAASEARAPESAAARHLAALNKKDGKGEKKPSRLRRAFSFSSASELKKAAEASSSSVQAAAAATASPAGPATTSQSRPSNKLRKEQPADDELMAREAAIVQRQEAGGLGSSIYSGQGHFFTGSTDNLSVSSTASSASLMLRKMGHGVKRSTRSLVGLFRPKSMVGAPGALAEPSAPAASAAQVSMVTVEAEREKVNVNLDPHDQVGGGTGFPRLERNSLDAASMGAGSEPALSFSSTSDGRTPAQTGMQAPRRSIVGGERERAEALAAVKKGILKRTGTNSGASSPTVRPLDAPPRLTDSPHSSAPSTPVSDAATPTSLGTAFPSGHSAHSTTRGHRRTDSVAALDSSSAAAASEHYFAAVARFGGGVGGGAEVKSLPGTPRNISFSPKVQFHDTWCSGEYDRRGDIATCNRLTPTLAQAIKEELNSFKMEMEVHESSKVYTHFF